MHDKTHVSCSIHHNSNINVNICAIHATRFCQCNIEWQDELCDMIFIHAPGVGDLPGYSPDCKDG